MSRFCRHNRLTAECPICSKGTVLDPARPAGRRPRTPSPGRRPAGATAVRGPYAAAGPYADGQEVRLERVPGGLRLAVWQAGQIARRAPELDPRHLSGLLSQAAEKGLLSAPRSTPEGGPVADGAYGASPGRTGEMRDELRVERTGEDRLRIARWILRPGAGWQLQDAPVMLPPARFAEALDTADARGVLDPGVPHPPPGEELDEQQVDG